MPSPFIIWTMQRTGGTTLAHLLLQMAGGPSLGHEPFNFDRKLGPIHRAFHETGDEEALRLNIREALATGLSMKHCYELVPAKLNAILLEEAQAAGYCHLILDRSPDSARVLSLVAAQLTGAWGKGQADTIFKELAAGTREIEPADVGSARRWLATTALRRQEIADLFTQKGLRPMVIKFEEFYTDPKAGALRVREVVDFIGITPAEIQGYEAKVAAALVNGGQNSNRIFDYLPNIDALRDALAQDEEKLRFSWAATGLSA